MTLDEWITQVSAKVSEEAGPQLVKIAEEAARRHGAGKIHLSQEDTIRMAHVLSETQDQSFLLGVKLGIEIVMKVEGPSTSKPV